jgi:hypothetical protein
MERTASELLDGLNDESEVDLLRRFAHQLPSLVISEMLGVPPADREKLTGWSDAVAPLLGVRVAPEKKAAAMIRSGPAAAAARQSPSRSAHTFVSERRSPVRKPKPCSPPSRYAGPTSGSRASSAGISVDRFAVWTLSWYRAVPERRREQPDTDILMVNT